MAESVKVLIRAIEDPDLFSSQHWSTHTCTHHSRAEDLIWGGEAWISLRAACGCLPALMEGRSWRQLCADAFEECKVYFACLKKVRINWVEDKELTSVSCLIYHIQQEQRVQTDSFFKTEKVLQHLLSHLAFMELRGKRGSAGCQDPRGQGMGFGIASGTPVSTVITAVRQQDYSASVWLRRREKLEHVSSVVEKTVKWNVEEKHHHAAKMF